MPLAIFSLAVGVISGLAGGGRFSNVGWRSVRLTWLPVAWAAGMALSTLLSGEAAFTLGLAGLACLAAFAVANTKVLSCMWLVALGLCLNVVVTADNHGMPYSTLSLANAGVRPKSYNDTPRSTALSHPERPGDQLLFLSDVIPVPPLRTVVSFGDLLVAFGLGSVAATAMWDRRPRRLREPRHLRPATDKFTPADIGPPILAPHDPVIGSAGHGSAEPVPEETQAPAHTVAPEPDPVGSPGFSARLLLIEATGDPSLLIDLTDHPGEELADLTASHVVGEALRRHALDERLLARAALHERPA